MIHLLVSLLLLPFTLLHMLFGLIGISTHILLIPLKIFARHPVKCIVIVGAIVLYFAIRNDPHSLDSLKQPKDKQAKNMPKGAIPMVEPISKFEDGDSAFATDLYTLMSDQERKAYSANYYKTMSTAADGAATSWSYYNIHGTLTPVKTFYNNVGRVCRTFTELLKVHHIQQTISGTACDNGGGTWCKLKPNATPGCGIGGSTPGPLDSVGNAVRNLF